MSDSAKPTTAAARRILREIWRKGGRPVSVFLALIDGVAIGYWSWLAFARDDFSWAFTLALSVGIIAQLIIRYKAPGAEIPVGDPVGQHGADNPIKQAELLYLVAQSSLTHYSGSQIALLKKLLLNPSVIRRRTEEEVTLGRRVTGRRVRHDLHLETLNDSLNGSQETLTTVLLPILVPPKGRLYERSVTKDENAKAVYAISQTESQQLAAGILFRTYQEAFGLPASHTDWQAAEGGRFMRLLGATVLVPAYKLNSASQISDRRQTIVGVFADEGAAAENRVCDIKESEQRESALNELRALADLFLVRYAVLALLPVSSTTSIETTYELETKSLSSPAQRSSALALTRLLQETFNIPTGHIAIPFAYARKSTSYHLYVTVPRGSYIGPAAVKEKGSAKSIGPNNKPETATATPYLRTVSRHGSYVHQYGRGLAALPQSEFSLRVYERPYGSELLGTLISIGVAILAALLRTSSADAGSASDTATVVLTLPLAIITVGLLYQPLARRSLTVSTMGVAQGVLASFSLVFLVTFYEIDITTRPLDRTHLIGSWNVIASIFATLAMISAGALAIRLLRYTQIQRGRSSR